VIITPESTHLRLPVLETAALRRLLSGLNDRALRVAPRTFTTLGGDTVEVEVYMRRRPVRALFYARFDIVAETVSAAAAGLGVRRDSVYIVDGTVILYHPTIDVTVYSAVADGDAIAGGCPATIVTLPTELGPTAEQTVLSTVRHARARIAEAVGLSLKLGKSPARRVMLSIRAASGDFAELTDLDATLAAAGIVDGAEVTIG